MNEDFIDAETFGGKEASTPREIVLQHVSRIMQLHSSELCGGYTSQKMTKGGEVVETYVEDKGESFINAVNILHDFLLTYQDEKYKEENKQIKKEFDDLYKDFEDKLEDENSIALYKKRKYLVTRQRMQSLFQLLTRLDYLSSERVEAE